MHKSPIKEDYHSNTNFIATALCVFRPMDPITTQILFEFIVKLLSSVYVLFMYLFMKYYI